MISNVRQTVMEEEQISVIVSVYNTEKYLNQCIQSILKQTYHNLELILVDDGSTDRSLAICTRYQQQDSRVRVFHQANQGVSKARNYGMDVAAGDLITFVDSDDYVMPNYLEELITALESTGSQIAISDFQSYKGNGQLLVHMPDHEVSQRTFTPREWFGFAYTNKNDFFQLIYTVLWGKLFQQEAFNQIYCPEDTQIDDEFTTWKTYLQASKIVYLDDEDYIYRLNQDGLSHRKNQEDIRPLRSLEEEITFLHILGYDPQLPLLRINQRYRISIKASSEPAQGFFTRIVFFNGQGDEINRLEFHNLEKAFTFPEGAVHYEVSLVNTGCTSLQFKRLEICPAKLPRSVHNDLWFHKPVNPDSDQPVNIVVMHDPKRVKKTWETVGKMLNGLPLQIVSVGWQYDGDLAEAIVHWIEQKNQLYAHLISTSADLDKVLRKVHQVSPKTWLLLTEASQDDKLHIDYEIYASRDIPEWSTANLVDPDWITITHAINGLWGGVKVK
ncbi:accessory Sec system protein Asp3 [Limosilactobacillus vaginalis]|uniref:accessory Sec system protein Asp3 n=1 Tax=Limosilactobacillus vaginalis TaxID=1633 RepID=UPI0036211956